MYGRESAFSTLKAIKAKKTEIALKITLLQSCLDVVCLLFYYIVE